MKHILIIALISSNIPLIYGEPITHNRMRAKFDERVELMSIICHLANYPEYNMDMGGVNISMKLIIIFQPIKIIRQF